ncbi:TPA: ATP-binding cassette domain-containing protein [Streptococcus suis]|nr:ATP-binding cassette domain-containing protein [Streptococcus suis]HEM5327314.1 ATP-binding cassette domain-containing protein [Streptococcus suis]
MVESMIVTKGLTKNYGKNRGVFDMNLDIKRGEVFGIVGVNGAGKTTTLRILMGFLKSSRGKVTIKGKDVWKESAALKRIIGYVPGEIAFPDTKSGQTFLKMQLELLRQKSQNNARVNHLIQLLKIDTTADIKRMSKGMKQKVALVCAFMTDADVLLLDEPTTGLDPVMRDVFIELVKDAKANGTTVIMSSHMFNELEPTCDRIAFMKNGRIVQIIDDEEKERLAQLQKLDVQTELYRQLTWPETSDVTLHRVDQERQRVSLIVPRKDTTELLYRWRNLDITNLTISDFGLDTYFAAELEA